MITIDELSGSELAIYDRLKEAIFAELSVAKIGIVTGFSTDTGLPTVQPLIKQRVVDTKGNTAWLEYPQIPDVLYAGDKPTIGSAVLLIICDDDTSPFLPSSGTNSSGAPITQVPQILSKHNMSHAVAIPLSLPTSTALGVSSSATASSSPTYAAITSSKTDAGIGISQAGIDFLTAWEGYRADWYIDDAGHWTIGIGHMNDAKTLPLGLTAPLSLADAQTLLAYDLPTYISGVASDFSGIVLTQQQKDALISFEFNNGAGSLAGTHLRSDIAAGASALQLKKDFNAWSNITVDGKLVPDQGLVYRRDAEWAMFVNGSYLKP